ncbi:hypothetical protein A2U01_0069296, partial [Trifolium medium]|nr:hypothetical protein [Trifolium medium]
TMKLVVQHQEDEPQVPSKGTIEPQGGFSPPN